MKVYLARPISGCTKEEVASDLRYKRSFFDDNDIETATPLLDAEAMRNEIIFKAKGYGDPRLTNRAIVQRDRWLVENSDVILADFRGSVRVSMGTCFELAWAGLHGKHVVIVIEENNIHQHGFVLEAADVIYDNLGDALNYIVSVKSSWA